MKARTLCVLALVGIIGLFFVLPLIPLSLNNSGLSIEFKDAQGNVVGTISQGFVPLTITFNDVPVTTITFTLAWNTDDPTVDEVTYRVVAYVRWMGGEPDIPQLETEMHVLMETSSSDRTGSDTYSASIENLCASVPTNRQIQFDVDGFVNFWADGEQITSRKSNDITFSLYKENYVYELEFGTSW